ncbi:MAG TPA: hypothetical protein VFX80_04605 [Solirubrobacteraceae bacterium]|nr:hypothetical protein [Solirubrobacteraceae bacterium]
MSDQTPPSFPVGGPTKLPWREHALTRSRELRVFAEWVRLTVDPSGAKPEVKPAFDGIHDHLEAAKEAAEDRVWRRWYSRARVSIGGAAVERANSNLDAAEAEVLTVAPLDYVRGQLPNLVAHVRAHLPADDARRMQVEAIAERATGEAFGEVERGVVVGAVRMASVESRRETTRVRSFRNVLYVSAALLTLVAIALVVIGIFRPQALPMCFNPDNEVVCPSTVEPVPDVAEGQAAPVSEADAVTRKVAGSWDILVVTLVGLVAAAVAAAASLKDIKGTSTPYSLPTALAVLKLPTGALTAFLGIQLMRGEFVPGLSALDSPAQIIAWAIVFGYAQQLLTGLVDKQAQGVLEEVGKANQPPANPNEAKSAAPVAPLPPDVALAGDPGSDR